MPLRTLDNGSGRSTHTMTPANTEVIVLSSDTDDDKLVVPTSLHQQQKKRRRCVDTVQNVIANGGNAKGKEKKNDVAGDEPGVMGILSSGPEGSDLRSEESFNSIVKLQRELNDMKQRLLNTEKVCFSRLLRCTWDHMDGVLVLLFLTPE